MSSHRLENLLRKLTEWRRPSQGTQTTGALEPLSSILLPPLFRITPSPGHSRTVPHQKGRLVATEWRQATSQRDMSLRSLSLHSSHRIHVEALASRAGRPSLRTSFQVFTSSLWTWILCPTASRDPDSEPTHDRTKVSRGTRRDATDAGRRNKKERCPEKMTRDGGRKPLWADHVIVDRRDVTRRHLSQSGSRSQLTVGVLGHSTLATSRRDRQVLSAASRTRRNMARAESRWSDEEMR